MSIELKIEKSIQHAIVHAQFLAKEFCSDGASATDILVAAAARAYSASHKNGQPDEWLGNEFAQYMKEACIEQIWPPIETLGKS